MSPWHRQRKLYLFNSVISAETSSYFANVNVCLIFIIHFVPPCAVIVGVGTVDCPEFEPRRRIMDFFLLQNVQSGFGDHRFFPPGGKVVVART